MIKAEKGQMTIKGTAREVINDYVAITNEVSKVLARSLNETPEQIIKGILETFLEVNKKETIEQALEDLWAEEKMTNRELEKQKKEKQ